MSASDGMHERPRREPDAEIERPGDGIARTTRVGDSDRQRASEFLGAHVAAGTLDLHEYERRLGAALQAATVGDLDEAVADLPAIRTQTDVDADRRDAWEDVRSWLGISALLIVIWALTGMDYFWPIWPILGIGLASSDEIMTLVRGPAPAGVLEDDPVWPRPAADPADDDPR